VSTTRVALEPWRGGRSLIIGPTKGGSFARVLPDLGANVVELRLPSGDGWIDVIEPPPDIDALRERPAGYGTSVLVPFPGRLHGGTFPFMGREVSIGPRDERGDALHGCVLARSWRWCDEAGGCAGTDALLSFASTDDPALVAEWPFPFSIVLRLFLDDTCLRWDLEIVNSGPHAMPFGAGLHPYLATGFGVGADRDDCEVTVAAEHQWGWERGAVTGVARDVAQGVDVRCPRRIGDLLRRDGSMLDRLNLLYSLFEHVEGRRPGDPGGASARLRHRPSGREVSIEAGAGLGAMMLFIPPWNRSIALEPYSCVPNAFNLDAEGVRCGMKVLRPGEAWRTWMTVAVSTSDRGG
jgi:aldose 1-epimerase